MAALREHVGNLVARFAYAAVTNGNATTLTLISLLSASVARLFHRRRGEA